MLLSRVYEQLSADSCYTMFMSALRTPQAFANTPFALMFFFSSLITAAQQYVPLFLCKEDLGIAVQSAYKQRNATQIKLYRDKAKKHEDDFNQVSKESRSSWWIDALSFSVLLKNVGIWMPMHKALVLVA